jgi:hypothetical protein
VAVAPLVALLALLGVASPAHADADTRAGATAAISVLVAAPAVPHQHSSHPDLPTEGVLATRPVVPPSTAASDQVDDVDGTQPRAHRATAATRAPPALQVTR